MGYFPVKYDFGVVIYKCKMFRLATGLFNLLVKAWSDLCKTHAFMQ